MNTIALNRQEVSEAYLSGRTTVSIARDLNCRVHRVRYVLNRENIPTRNNDGGPKPKSVGRPRIILLTEIV